MSTAVEPLLRVTDLSVTYGVPRKGVGLGTGAALRGANLEVYPGEIVGIIGETGSGKTTLARATVGLTAPASGSIEFEGRDLTGLRGRELRNFRRQGRIQLVFQDPLRSLDPDLTVARLVAEPLEVAGGIDAATRAERADRALREVGLEPEVVRERRPRELSGGQRQRVSLARAIVTEPRLLICDEPVSALDVSNRNLVLNLLDRLRRDLGVAVVIIAHDLSSLAGIGDRVAVFYRSRLVEQGNLREVLTRPAHPYTALLVASAPSLGDESVLRPADIRVDRDDAGPVHSGGCVFADRCRFAVDACATRPALREVGERWSAACHLADRWRDDVIDNIRPVSTGTLTKGDR
ncbi:ABC transporter ATP-binding protein [Nocardia macrotermitis]|uniref:Putative D,D-dipeptide transport ATP-binding protein DdpF n=1 Tax=Nocardia macrotermitis TaxID=2585198 RepID=A0A7K0D6Z5_9NOCA|nr:ABC transporter ATP-binding protein [Nocardia macrotermitis]MQY21429.1 putative D,D-dipeptide transport ATP-binding protein DdpF [Nocardia macrotermitis]